MESVVQSEIIKFVHRGLKIGHFGSLELTIEFEGEFLTDKTTFILIYNVKSQHYPQFSGIQPLEGSIQMRFEMN